VQTADDDDAPCFEDGLDEFLELSRWIWGEGEKRGRAWAGRGGVEGEEESHGVETKRLGQNRI